MNKKSKLYILALVWVGAIIQICINEGINREEKIVEALNIYDSNPYEAKISAYGYYGDGFISESVKASMVTNLAKELGVTSGYSVDHVYGGSCQSTNLKKEGVIGDTTIKVLSMEVDDKEGNAKIEQYIMIDTELHQSIEASYDYKEKVEELLKSYGVKATLNIYVSTKVDGVIDEITRENIKEKFLTMMRASEIESGEFADVYTIYGYTRDIDDYVYQNGKKVNVNIAFSYDDEIDETVIHMAIPFVDKSY